MCGVGAGILEDKDPLFIAKIGRLAYEKFELLIGKDGQMQALSAKTGLTYMQMPKPNFFSWAKLCKPIYFAIYAINYGKVFFAQEGERNKRLGITMSREAEKALTDFHAQVKAESSQKWTESTLVHLYKCHDWV